MENKTVNVIIEINKTDHIVTLAEAKRIRDNLHTNTAIIRNEVYVIAKSEAVKLEKQLLEYFYV